MINMWQLSGGQVGFVRFSSCPSYFQPESPMPCGLAILIQASIDHRKEKLLFILHA